jgi:hypothetical protein
MSDTAQQGMNVDRKFDSADLVSSLLAMDAPSRSIDQVVEIMLGGDQVRHEIPSISVLGNKWLYSETPFYTRDYKAVEMLAAKLGVISTLEKTGIGYVVTAIHHKSGKRKTASASMATTAALAAICSSSYGV